jgi:hypothetical protein
MLGYIGGVAAVMVMMIVVYHLIKGAKAESARGKKIAVETDILDELPKRRKALYLGEKVPEWKTDNRKKAIEAALKFLSVKDNFFEVEYLTKIARQSIRQVKAAMEVRSEKKIERRVTPSCLEILMVDVEELRGSGRLHIFGELEITDVAIVHFEATPIKEKHTFTALISVKSMDYYQDDKSGKLLRGDKKLYAYQEFWCFRRTNGRWLVDLIRPSADMDTVLNSPNVMSKVDLAKFSKNADPELLREFVAR